MNIAIVDDDPTLRISLKHFLTKWHNENSLSLSMTEYDNGDSFLAECEKENYDVVFMDIFMENKNGIETATEMRSFCKDTILIFLTSSADHMPDAFAVHAFGYLLKPLLADKLYKIMDDVKSVSVKDEPTLEIISGKVTLNPKFSEIRFIQSDSNYCMIYCPDQVKCRGPFSSLCEPLLESEDFCVINRGILVNFAHVSDLDQNGCVMRGGETLPVNIKKASQIKQDYLSYKFSHR